MENENYGPIGFLIGSWRSKSWTGENRAPDPDRKVENTKFRQEMEFVPAGLVENHEQSLYVLRYSTKAWEEGNDEDPFHEEVGYFIWDKENQQVLKSFIVPRGIAVNAGGTASEDAKKFRLEAKLGSPTYGICSNLFLDEEFPSESYTVTFTQHSENSFSYDENTIIRIKGQEKLFHHTEKNTLERV